MNIKQLLILLLLISLFGCALPGYKTVELLSGKDPYTGKETLETRISFPQATSQAQVIYRHAKTGELNLNFLVGKFWLEDWGFFKSADILIDNNNNHLNAMKTKRNVLSNASVEELIYIDLDDEIIDRLSKCKSLRMRFNGEKDIKEFIFDADKINMVKRWIDQISKS